MQKETWKGVRMESYISFPFGLRVDKNAMGMLILVTPPPRRFHFFLMWDTSQMVERNVLGYGSASQVLKILGAEGHFRSVVEGSFRSWLTKYGFKRINQCHANMARKPISRAESE